MAPKMMSESRSGVRLFSAVTVENQLLFSSLPAREPHWLAAPAPPSHSEGPVCSLATKVAIRPPKVEKSAVPDWSAFGVEVG